MTIFTVQEQQVTLNLTAQGTVQIDWGDNTQDTASGNVSISHTYQDNEQHEIKITSNNNYTLNENFTTKFIDNVVLDDKVKLGERAFYGCYTMNNITLPANLTRIPKQCFYACNSLYSITIPSTVTLIEELAFDNCKTMREYIFLSETPPTLQANVFKDINEQCKIFVPAGSINMYKNQWEELANKIKEQENG